MNNTNTENTSTNSYEHDPDNYNLQDPIVIDLINTDHDMIVQQIIHACSTTGFFHVMNHNISTELIQNFRYQLQQYFTVLPTSMKDKYRRNESNSRGYFDNEYTKQKLDWKYCLDVGIPRSRDWDVLPDNNIQNICLDGYNQFPTNNEVENFRTIITSYYDECTILANRIASYMMEGIILQLQKANEYNNDSTTAITIDELRQKGKDIIDDLYNNHTSYLRMNYYRPCPPPTNQNEIDESTSTTTTNTSSPLGISPHRDAGFLTILLQDDDCHSLQVPIYSDNEHDDSSKTIVGWQTVGPIRNGFTINTGDMAQIVSNGLYKAPLHRVITNPIHERYSAPYFYNPGYNTYMYPLMFGNTNSNQKNDSNNSDIMRSTEVNKCIVKQRYHPCLWGYYRAIRFAGDVTDLGVEIQVEDYEIDDNNNNKDDGITDDQQQLCVAQNKNKHIHQQAIFAQQPNIFDEPFSVNQFRKLFDIQE